MNINIPYNGIKYFTFAESADFLLQNGDLFGPITIAYETFGKLNDNKDNSILVIHALTGDTHATSGYDMDDSTPGWWDTMVGPAKPIDTNKYHVICCNVFGGCMGTTGPSSINPATGNPYGKDFPLITVKDMVNVQKKLIDHLGINRLKSVIGGSLGGMVALEWAVAYPDILETTVIIASGYKTSPQIVAFYEVGRNAILADPEFADGNYYDGKGPQKGLAIARMIAHITYLSKTSIEDKFGKNLQEDVTEDDLLKFRFGPMFAVESYLRHQGRKFVDRFDANSYLYITKAMDMYDLTSGGATLLDVLTNIKSRTLIISFDSDWHFTPQDSWHLVKAMMNLGKDVTYVNLESPFGHDAFLLENGELERVIYSFINNSKGGK